MAAGSALHIMKTSFPEGFDEPVIATLLREVLKALVYLHSQGHIHRDVKVICFYSLDLQLSIRAHALHPEFGLTYVKFVSEKKNLRTQWVKRKALFGSMH